MPYKCTSWLKYNKWALKKEKNDHELFHDVWIAYKKFQDETTKHVSNFFQAWCTPSRNYNSMPEVVRFLKSVCHNFAWTISSFYHDILGSYHDTMPSLKAFRVSLHFQELAKHKTPLFEVEHLQASYLIFFVHALHRAYTCAQEPECYFSAHFCALFHVLVVHFWIPSTKCHINELNDLYSKWAQKKPTLT